MAEQFRGFPPGALAFFGELATHNDREWFNAHKDDYERSLKAPMMDLVADLTTALSARSVPLHGEPRRALFRLHRDVRFSKDKSPYKTHIAAVLTRDGEKSSQGFLYVHCGHDERFGALGFYQLEPPQLAAFRDRIVGRPGDWAKVESALSSSGLALSREGAASRLPSGYDAAALGELADVLKLRSFLIRKPFTEGDLGEPALVTSLVDFAVAGMPLLAFGWSALEGVPDRPRRR